MLPLIDKPASEERTEWRILPDDFVLTQPVFASGLAQPPLALTGCGRGTLFAHSRSLNVYKKPTSPHDEFWCLKVFRSTTENRKRVISGFSLTVF